MILAREILSGDHIWVPVRDSWVYLFGILVRSVAWLGGEVGVIDHMGGRWTFRPDDHVRCIQRWNGAVPA